MPKSIKNKPAGDIEIQKDIFSGFAWALTVGVILIYAVLVLLFNGFLQPLTIMMSLPLSLGGALIALMISGDFARILCSYRNCNADGTGHQKRYSLSRIIA